MWKFEERLKSLGFLPKAVKAIEQGKVAYFNVFPRTYMEDRSGVITAKMGASDNAYIMYLEDEDLPNPRHAAH